MNILNIKYKQIIGLFLTVSLYAAPFAAFAVIPSQAAARMPLFVSMNNNSSANSLVAYSSTGSLVGTFPTGGAGGVGGNAGAVQVHGNMVVVPDFGSKDLAIFTREGNSFVLKGNIPTAAAPVSVTFGQDHIYVLETSQVESFKISDNEKGDNDHERSNNYKEKNNWIHQDGSVQEIKADGSAGQIGYLTDGHVIYTEKSGAIAEIALNNKGAVSGSSVLVSNLPASLNTPLGLDTKGSIALVTSAHDNVNQQLLVANGAVVNAANGTNVFPTDADCWNVFFKQFVFSSDSPGKKIDRFTVKGSGNLAFDGVATNLTGAPTDLSATDGGLLGVIWSGNVSMYQINNKGQLSFLGTAASGPLNGAAWSE